MDQVYRSHALIRVGGEPSHQIAQRLTWTENPDRLDQFASFAGECRRARGGDQDPAGRPGWPKPFEIRRIGQIVEHHEPGPGRFAKPAHEARRSEEHTSELQSPCNLVCRLLLEKKK